MEIKDEEIKALQEMFNLLQQLSVMGADNIHIMSASLSRLQGVLQSIDGRKQEELKNKKEVKT